jgi:hypothetical protein
LKTDRCRAAMREAKYLPRRCRDGLQKNLLILTIVTVLD